MTLAEADISAWWLPWFAAACCCAPFSALLWPRDGVFPDDKYCDYESFQLPVREFARGEFLAGRFPLWNPYLGCGTPLHAGQQASLCHPLLTGMSVLFGANHGTKAALFAQLLLCFAGEYRLARRLGTSRAAASFAAMVATDCGFMVSHLMVGHVTIIAGYALVPWLLLALDRLLASPGPLTAVSLGAVITCFFFAGQPQILYYALLACGAWAMGSLATGDAARRLLAVLLWGGAAIFVAALCSLVQLLPTIELIGDGIRSSHRGTESYAAGFCLDGADLSRLLVPNLRGNPFIGPPPFDGGHAFHERVGYLGLLTPCLAVFGLSRASAARWQWGAAAIVVLALALALGPNTPAFGLAGNVVPGFLLFRCPGRLFCVVSPLAGLLAARGLDALVTRASARVGRRLFAFYAALWILLNIAAWVIAREASADGWRRWARYAGQALGGELRAAGLLALGSGAVLAFCRVRGRSFPDVAYALALAVTFVDLGYNNARNFYLVPRADAPELRQAPTDLKEFRVVDAPGGAWPSPASLRYSRLVPAAMKARWRTVATNEGGVLPSALERLYASVGRAPQPVLALASCAWIFRRGTDSWEVVPNALPRIRFVRDPISEIVDVPIELVNDSVVAALKEHTTTAVIVLCDEAHRLVVQVDAPADGILVVADTFYPGWRVRVDGCETPIRAAHGVFRGVRIGAGRHRVEFCCEPASFRCGLAGTAVGVFLAAGLATYGLAHRRGNLDTHSIDGGPA